MINKKLGANHQELAKLQINRVIQDLHIIQVQKNVSKVIIALTRYVHLIVLFGMK